MPDPTLLPGQCSIGKHLPNGDPGALVYGRGTGLDIIDTVTDTGAIVVQDQAVVGHDGTLFGYDTLPGMVVTQNGRARASSGPAALDAYSALAGAWNDPVVRLADGAVQVLRVFWPGSAVVRRTYGRVMLGLIPWTAQFQSADNTWYSDTAQSVTLTQTPSYRGTITPPLTPPYQLAPSRNFQQNTIINSGSLPTWPVITFTGPHAYPGLTYTSTPVVIGYGGILGATDTLVIDTRPWARTALLNGTTSVAGLLTGAPMIALQVQPGATVCRLTGQDYTGTATCTISWRNANLSMGGST